MFLMCRFVIQQTEAVEGAPSRLMSEAFQRTFEEASAIVAPGHDAQRRWAHPSFWAPLVIFGG
jgi:hypothetical protein